MAGGLGDLTLCVTVDLARFRPARCHADVQPLALDNSTITDISASCLKTQAEAHTAHIIALFRPSTTGSHIRAAGHDNCRHLYYIEKTLTVTRCPECFRFLGYERGGGMHLQTLTFPQKTRGAKLKNRGA